MAEKMASLTPAERAKVLIEALPYMQAYWHKVVVIKFGGSAMLGKDSRSMATLRSILTDVVFMEQVGMWPVLVHGGGLAISQALEEQGIQSRFVDGLRVTDEPTLQVVQHVLIDDISDHIVRGMKGVAGMGIPLNGRGSPFLTARKRETDGPPLGFVGEVDKVDRALCERLLEGGVVPVVAPIARDETGQLYNINADSAARAIAEQMGAEKLIFLSDVPGILRTAGEPESRISTLHVQEARELLGEGVVAGGMIPKVEACLHALEAGVRKTHIVSGLIPHALLLEMFTDEGIGTQILR